MVGDGDGRLGLCVLWMGCWEGTGTREWNWKRERNVRMGQGEVMGGRDFGTVYRR